MYLENIPHKEETELLMKYLKDEKLSTYKHDSFTTIEIWWFWTQPFGVGVGSSCVVLFYDLYNAYHAI